MSEPSAPGDFKNPPPNLAELPENGNPVQPASEEIDLNHSLNDILLFARNKQASDVHFTPGMPLIFRQFGLLKAQTKEKISFEKITQFVESAFSQEIVKEFLKEGDIEFVHSIEGGGRFRITIIKHRLGWDITARVSPIDIIPFERSGMPISCREIIKWTQGLILIAGPAGCGKSTTLNTLIEMINQTRRDHIITIEKPIEFIYTPKRCQITQREIGRDTRSQQTALRAALREDPDIIVISELRGLENIQIAVSAAETGHLVFGTMNTINSVQTITNLIHAFPPEEESIITTMLTESLRGVICQQLIPKKDGTGVIPAFEVIIMNNAIGNLIRSGKTKQITNMIATGKASGMILLDHYMEGLQTGGIISEDEVKKRSSYGIEF